MSITEDNVKLNNIYMIPELYEGKKIIIDKLSKCYFGYNVFPYIEGLIKNFNPGNKKTYPIFHAKFIDSHEKGFWFTFRYYINEEFFDTNNVAIYLDDAESGHSLWCGGQAIQELVIA